MKETTLRVETHPSGRFTLTQQDPPDRMPRDCAGPLFGNLDEQAFYRAVGSKLRELRAQGVKVTLYQ